MATAIGTATVLTGCARNPFAEAPYVYTWGHRNPQGLAVAADGTAWLHEHGPRGGDEVNRLEAGVNYGWPAITHGKDYSGALVSPYTEWPGMAQPDWQWTPSIAPSGLAVGAGDLFPAWRGDLFIGGWWAGRLKGEIDEVRLYGELHRFVPVLADARGYRVGELVIHHRPRKFGRSKYGVTRFVKGFLDLLTVKFLTGFGQRPQHMLGTLGLLGITVEEENK